jgi:hypothetical protein
MITVLLKRDLRYDIATIPDNVLSLTRGNINCGNGEVAFDVVNEIVAAAVKGFLEMHRQSPMNGHINNGIYEISLSTNTAAPGAGIVQQAQQPQDPQRETCPVCNE